VHLLDFIPGNLDIEEKLRADDFDLPFDNVNELKKSSLSYHLVAEEDPEDIISLWGSISECKTLIRFEKEDEEY
jgi:hypothetical protein